MIKNPKMSLDEESLQAIAEMLDRQTAVLPTKEELKDQTAELKAYIHEGVQTVMDGMTDLEDRVDVRVTKLEKDVRQLKLKHSEN